jgi:hypothetical protein
VLDTVKVKQHAVVGKLYMRRHTRESVSFNVLQHKMRLEESPQEFICGLVSFI